MSAHDSKRQPLLEAEHLSTRFRLPRRRLLGRPHEVQAVRDVSLRVDRGETLGLVGESGSGKTTLGRTLLRLTAPTHGRIHFDGQRIDQLSQKALRPLRPRMQMVFQDPFGSLNPRIRIGDAIAEGLYIQGGHTRSGLRTRTAELLQQVQLDPAHARRYPHALSGGQRQRVCIARALATEPELLVADEPISALDVSVQAQIISLFRRLRSEQQLTMVFIAHDLAVVANLSDRIAVLYLGQIMELGTAEQIIRDPRHPYTSALAASVPRPDPTQGLIRPPIVGEPPSPSHPPSGCPFRTRCPHAIDACAENTPALRELRDGRSVACLRDDILTTQSATAA